MATVAAAFVGTVAFALLFGVPKRFYPACGFIGAAGWLLYLLLEGAGQDADLVVSVFHEDDLSGTPSFALSGALQGGEAIPGGRTGEYEGEIIYASVEGLDAASADSENVTAFLSTTGSIEICLNPRSAR